MKQLLSILVTILAALPVVGQQTFVIPVVTDETPGANGSTWVTEVQIAKMDPHDILTVRRLWVCTVDGGFLEPVEALTWDMNDSHTTRMRVLSGGELLQGTGAGFGAVAFEVVGGEVIVNARIADISLGFLENRTPFGQGQRVPTDRAALVGPSHIPWLGGCHGVPCTAPEDWPEDLADQWDIRLEYYRTNIGLVNPNPRALTITATAIPFGGGAGTSLAVELPDAEGRYETFTISVPAFGWTQIPWSSSNTFSFGLFNQPFRAYVGFILALEPDSDLPYHAYSSTVFSPDPDSGISTFNDPMFVSASPGRVTPYHPNFD